MSEARNNDRTPLRVEKGGKAVSADRLPPNNLEFEQAVLGCALMSESAARKLPTALASEDFYLTGHRFIYAAICDLIDKGSPVDVLTVPQHLKATEMLDRVGGMPYFATLADSTPTSAHFDYYAEQVRTLGTKRALQDWGRRAEGMADDPELSPDEIIAKADEGLTQVRRLALRGKPQAEPMTYAELMAADLPEPIYLIDKMFPQGCTLVHSAPKEGKTRLLTDLGIATTTGGKFLGEFKTLETGGLFLFLEDNQVETKSRLEGLLEQGPKPQNLHIAWEWDTMDRGGLERLDDFFTRHPEVKLLVIDTLEYIRPPIQKDGQLYSQDVAALRKLKDFADKHSAFVVILHHSNKSKEHSDDVILSAGGTNGIAGSCDTIMQLQGKPDGTKVFRGKGRRIPPFAHLVKMDDRAGYQFLGDADKHRQSGEELELLESLSASQWAMKETEIAQDLGVKRESIRGRCRRAAERKLVVKQGRAEWGLTDEGRRVLAELNASNSTDIQSVQSIHPVHPVQPIQSPAPSGEPVDPDIPLPEEPPGHPGQGGWGGQTGRTGQTGQGGYLFDTPQSPPPDGTQAPLLSDDPVLPENLSLEEEQDRVICWALAQEQQYPWSAEVGFGPDQWRMWVERDRPNPAEVRMIREWLEVRSKEPPR